MIRLAACLAGTYFVAFATTSLVVAGSDAPATGAAIGDTEKSEPAQVAAKADRLARVGEAPGKRRVAEVELFGAVDVVVILRDGEGREVYRIDHASNMTIAARDVALPQLRLHAQTSEERVREEKAREEIKRDSQEPPGPAGSPDGGVDDAIDEEQIFACESGLSALADREAASLPRVCLADASDDLMTYASFDSRK